MSVSTVPRPAAIAAVLATADRWTPGRRKADGRRFYIVPGSQTGVTYYADSTDCTCPDARQRGRTCKHSLAIRAYQERHQSARTADQTADHLSRLEAALAARAQTLRLVGYLEGEEHEDGQYTRLLTDIERIKAGGAA